MTAKKTTSIVAKTRTVEAAGETFTVRPFTFGQAADVEANASNINALLGLAVGKDADWVEALPLDEGLALLTAVTELNAKLFAKADAKN